MEFVILETFENYIDANLAMGRMEEAGINCWLKKIKEASPNVGVTVKKRERIL